MKKIGEQLFSGVCKLQAIVAFYEQRKADLFLKRINDMGNPWLGISQSLCRFRNASKFNSLY